MQLPNKLYSYKLTCKICIDMANGHMEDLLETVKMIKRLHPYVTIMTGNIANPKTYIEYEKAGVDYVRVGIGGGCFTENMEVITNKGLKKIKDMRSMVYLVQNIILHKHKL